MPRTGILLLNLGTPDDPSVSAVRRYLKQFLLDYRVIDINPALRSLLVRGIIAPFRAPKSAKAYKELWTENGSPLKYYGYRIEEQLQEKLGEDFLVLLAMRYQNPSVPDMLNKMRKHNVDRIIVFPMFPQYASASTGSALEEAMRVISSWPTIPELSVISSYHNNDAMLDLYAENARNMGLDNYEHFLFSYHGIPQRQLYKSDCNNYCLKKENCCSSITEQNKSCYSAQCFDTSRKLAAKLGISEDKFSVAFQSRLGPDKWTEPFTPDVLEELIEKGIKNVMVFSPSFTADCLETTIEIGDEYQEEFIEMGGEKLDLVPSLNDDPRWVNVIHDIVAEHFPA